MYLRTLLGYKLMPLLIIRITRLFDILLNYLYSFYSHMMMIRSWKGNNLEVTRPELEVKI